MKPRIMLASVLAFAACGPKYIENTKVIDTPENRQIADVIEKYRQAVERRDVDALKELISRRYFTGAGTTANSEDDYGYEQLEQKVLPMLRDDVKSVQYARSSCAASRSAARGRSPTSSSITSSRSWTPARTAGYRRPTSRASSLRRKTGSGL